MDEFVTNPTEEVDLAQAPETPEDVAVLYTWANVHGGKYRDFSASRREYRAQQRHRQVEAQREAELEAAREREEKAALELEEARLLEAGTDNDTVSPEEAEEIRRRAEERAEQEYMAAQKHVRTAEELRVALEQAERELEDARRRADEQAARYAEADARWRAQQRGMAEVVPGEIADPYYYAGPLEPGAFAPGRGVRSSVPQRISSERRIVDSYYRARGESSTEAEAGREEARRDEGTFETGGGDPSRTGARPETPEDTLERNRPDERERTLREPEGRFEDSTDDGYYDRSFEQHPAERTAGASRLPSEWNSGPAEMPTPARPQQPQPAMEPGDRRFVRPEDSMPGKTRAPEESFRIRRRESAADALARTTRRPRSAGDSLPSAGYSELPAHDAAPESRDPEGYTPAIEPRQGYEAQEPAHVLTPRADASRLPERSVSRDHAGTEEPPARPTRTHYDDRPQPAAAAPVRSARDESAGREERPAWLGREARAGEKSPEARERETEGRRERDAFEEFLARTADVTPRLTDDRPARSSYVERADPRDAPPADPQSEFAAEGHQDEVAERRRDSRRARSAAGFTHEMPGMLGAYGVEGDDIPADRNGLREAVPAPREAASVREAVAPREMPRAPLLAESSKVMPRTAPEPSWPRVERRRYERSTGSRGVEPHLDSSREYRAAARAAQAEEKSDRSRSQSARREVELRENFRNDAQAASRAEFVARGREARLAPIPSPAGTPVGTTRHGSTQGASESDTLQQSRERVASRWFALKGLMGPNAEPTPDTPPPARTARETNAPMLSVIALSGGVGKTSLVATLGRALSSVGEKVLLADTTAHGLLPYYFGARELRPDVVRTFSPPPGSSDATVYMVNYETDRLAADEAGQENLVEEILHHSKGTQRVLLDLNGSSAWLARRLARLNSSVLVPIAPDMNSVLSIQAVERFFSGTQDGEGRPVSPYYVLNQFDASLPLHLDVREVLRQQLGNRLLPVMIRRSQSVAEALAEGMTVFDYAPESPVTEDYEHLAEWVRNLAAPASVGLRNIRWSER